MTDVGAAGPGPAATKAALRTWARRRRSELDVPTFSARLEERIAALPEYAPARTVLLYLSMPDEVRVEGLAERDDLPPRRFLVPRCAANRRLALHPYAPGATRLLAGPFGIREPDPSGATEVEPTEVDLAVVPALLLSETGDRLGYGGGYYDRLLPRLRADCVRVGAAPDALLLPQLPHDPWDAAIDVIVTESRTLRARPGRQAGVADAVS